MSTHHTISESDLRRNLKDESNSATEKIKSHISHEIMLLRLEVEKIEENNKSRRHLAYIWLAFIFVMFLFGALEKEKRKNRELLKGQDQLTVLSSEPVSK